MEEDECNRSIRQQAPWSHVSSDALPPYHRSMITLFFAAEVAAPPGDDLLGLALAMFGAAMLVTAIATWVVTPKNGNH